MYPKKYCKTERSSRENTQAETTAIWLRTASVKEYAEIKAVQENAYIAGM
jgi:hypothetical protein